MQPDLLDLHVLHHFRTRSPLTHCMTNDVVQTFTANVLLALGASPAMVIEAEEAEQFAAIADALLVNVGTLTAPRAQSMRRAIESAVAAGKPWTLDPVAVGALAFRTRFCHQILALKPAAIRGNASEILALAGMSAGGRGVDTTDTAASAVPAAQALARQINTIVVVTGEVDYITDGQRTRTVTGGDVHACCGVAFRIALFHGVTLLTFSRPWGGRSSGVRGYRWKAPRPASRHIRR